MQGRVDPPHDQVTLSVAERRTMATLELAMTGEPPLPRLRACEQLDVRPGLVLRTLLRLLGWVGVGPWLVPVGTVIVVAALPWSVAVSFFGSLLVALGMAACAGRPWARSPLVWLLGSGGTRD